MPSGRKSHDKILYDFPKLKECHCYPALCRLDYILSSIGTLGGGNHFIEIDKDEEDNKYLIIHTGSRNFGKQVAEFYQNEAIEIMQGRESKKQKIQDMISEYKRAGREREIQNMIQEINKENHKLNCPKEFCYLEGKMRDHYLHDMKICQEYAVINRQMIAKQILEHMH